MARPLKRSKQLILTFKSWGGSRKGAGRKPKGERPLVVHTRRPVFRPSRPVHVTLRVARSVPNLRSQASMKVLRSVFTAAKGRLGLRLVHYSVQRNHIHLLVETSDGAVSRAMQGLCVRIARRLNGELRRRGSVFADRFHARVLGTPREVRFGLAYVLLNQRHHAFEHGGSATSLLGLDPCSSSSSFDGWARPRRAARTEEGVEPPRTWLLSAGWRRHGLIDPFEVPSRGRN